MAEEHSLRLEELKQRARHLKSETFALYLASRDPRTPCMPSSLWPESSPMRLAPLISSPIFIPVIGYLDDLVLIPWVLPWQ
ncbi:conserved hypothetical protein [Thiobacillus denitrificans ATCC 25259]|uniref:Uncharacterized protein n=1 Tax=Thiobacillus denitrificans (strain ATCC 25259 / T1) TaxID=292415 RepID=Q3SLT9_THIDA|nr:conserved hypothetical protein [Thiobacillus denitrificans ATCC 25259]